MNGALFISIYNALQAGDIFSIKFYTMNKTVLITGASSGIGLELAHIHASKGDNLILIARSKKKLDEFKLQMEKQYGVTVYNIGKDLTEVSAPIEIYDELKAKKIHVDYLVNNAGVGDFGHFASSDWDKQMKMINLNIMALTHLTRLLLPDMIKKRYGKILNVASTAAFQPGPTMAVYFATKAYVLSFSEALANEVKRRGVTVTALCPGATNTGFKSASALENSSLFKSKHIATSKNVAEFGYRAMMRGQTVAIHGVFNYLLTLLMRFVPRNLVTSIARRKLRVKKMHLH